MSSKKFMSDFLVIGSGVAGLTFAIRAAEFGTVNIVTKKKDFESNTNYAQGGISSVIDPADSYEEHITDTNIAGVGLCNPKSVEIMVKSGAERIRELISWGAKFSYTERDGEKTLELGREGGHSRNRIVHAHDYTGAEIEKVLLDKINLNSNIKLFEDYTAIDLLTEHQLKFLSSPDIVEQKDSITCYGAYVLDNKTGNVYIFESRVTMIASGGAGNVYHHTTNPSVATGDGIAMAYRAGALIGDMEFIQFHPTALYVAGQKGKSFLISEAVRGQGGILKNLKGERFMEKVHPQMELAPRDIVARAIDKELKKHGDSYVLLDITFKGEEFIKNYFPNIYKNCLEIGLDITKEPIPVVPAAHYLCGGVVTDINGKSSIHNLYVAGESACTGVHGANRLASNSLEEALVFAHRASEDAIDYIKKNKDSFKLPDYPEWNKEGTYDHEEWILIQHNVEEIQRFMWDYVGIVRTNLRLQRALRRIEFLEAEIFDYYKRSTLSSELLELRNMVAIAKLIVHGAIERKESRGLHYNTDYPETSEDMKINIIQKNNGQIIYKNLESFSF